MTERFPEWLRRTWASGPEFDETKRLLDGLGLNTVCQSARCPNQGECWKHRTATLMILGNRCTRGCAFCAVPTSAEPGDVDPEEPGKVAQAVSKLKLAHVVITSVTRDDLADGGAGHFAQVLDAIHELSAGGDGRGTRSRFRGRRSRYPTRPRRAPKHLWAQHRDRGAPVSRRASSARPIRRFSRGLARRGPIGARSRREVRPHGRPR